MLAIGVLVAGCTTLDKHVIDHEPEDNFCQQLPYPFSAQYADGTTFLEVKPGPKGAVEWTYFDHTGAPILVERSLADRELYFAVYYPSGQKRLAGAYKINGSQYVPQRHWELFTETGATDERDLPADFFEFRPMEVDHQQPPNYPEPTLYEGFAGNSCHLICVDEKGELGGAFPIEKNADVFDPAIRRTYTSWQYAPRKIGDAQVPSCAKIKMRFRS
jgi:hypothetical protein